MLGSDEKRCAMNIEVYSFTAIQERAQEPFPANTALISIGDVGAQPAFLLHSPDHILRLEFNDISLDWLDSENGGKYACRLFAIDQARQIADFVARHWDESGLLICQCQGGVSRSAAVAAAIRQHYCGDGMGYFVNPRYHPNPYVFSLTMEALGEKDEQ